MTMQQSIAEQFYPDGKEPVFDEPWMARAFALTVRLHQRGVFGWSQWSRYLADAIASNTEGSKIAYYENWLQALENLLRDQGIVGAKEYLEEIRQLRFPAGESGY